ncbi:hypothetical protein CLV41_103170 [Roseibium marinum]|uniref:Uncharacterized protein n=1 Tax=Roseibium marinum TaxID=281252 RepID=A0A2S3UXS1_9HYPH|nr:hypothetical protein CLV41_103170 [Roseibium marinum]
MRRFAGFGTDESQKSGEFRMEEAKISATGEPVTASFQPFLISDYQTQTIRGS